MILINDQQSLQRCIESLLLSEVIAYDTETTGLNVRKDKVVGIALTTQNKESFYIPLLNYNASTNQLEGTSITVFDIAVILNILKTKKLLMFNASYDCRITASNFNIDLTPALYADVMLMKHTCDENPPFSLKDIAVLLQEKLGMNMEKAANQEQLELLEHLKAKGASLTKDNYEIFKADIEILGKYACADTELTFKIYNHYLFQLERDDSLSFFFDKEVMPLYKNVTIPMESRGIPVDVPALIKAKEDIQNDINELERSIQSEIEPLLTEFEDWYLDLKYPCKTTGPFVQAFGDIIQVDLPVTKTGRYKLDSKSLKESKHMDTNFLDFIQGRKRLSHDTIRNIQWQMFQCDGIKYMFNLSSKHHLKKLFFSKLKLKPTTFTELGNPQVDDKFLESIKADYPWVQKLLDYNSLIKIKGAYIERLLEDQENGIWYPSFMQHRTTSGRYGGDAQQLNRKKTAEEEPSDIVRKYNNMIRDFIIAAPGWKLVDADYTSIEVVVFADDSQDEVLLDIIRKNLDLYSQVAIEVNNIQGASADKAAPNYLGKINKNARQMAKAYSLGIRYGLGGYKLSKDLNISQAKADQIVKNYFKKFPKLRTRMDEIMESAKELGYVKSKAGRIRRLPGLKTLMEEHGEILFNGLRLWEEYNERPEIYAKMKEKAKLVKNMINNSLNFPIQSLAASIISQSSIAIMKEFKNKGMQAYIALSIHDELCIHCPESEVEDVKRIMQYHMENTIKLSLPLNAEPNVGDKYGELK